MGAQAFDLADRLQSPVFVMLDLDIGMNEWLVRPFAWDDKKTMDRGKVMTAEELEAGMDFGRYLDVDGDAIPYRTYPGTHPTRGAYFTRGTSRDRYAKYSELGTVYVDNMARLLRKFETAKKYMPAPVRRDAKQKTKYGVLYFGSTTASMHEALDTFEGQGIHLDALRLRAFPFADEVVDFIRRHDQVFVVEQNRDAQLRTLIMNECGIDPARIVPVLHYDGTPITARFITDEIGKRLAALNVAPLREVAR
jgi:2-oxoglutarate ferredoxin oxidoreductase subunit alpha